MHLEVGPARVPEAWRFSRLRRRVRDPLRRSGRHASGKWHVRWWEDDVTDDRGGLDGSGHGHARGQLTGACDVEATAGVRTTVELASRDHPEPLGTSPSSDPPE